MMRFLIPLRSIRNDVCLAGKGGSKGGSMSAALASAGLPHELPSFRSSEANEESISSQFRQRNNKQ